MSTTFPVAIPTMPAAQLKRILYATDLSEASRKALPLLSAIARKYDSEIYVANIWFPLPYSMGAPDAPLALEAQQSEDALSRTREISESEQLAGVPKTLVVEQGDVVEEIAKIVREQNVDLVLLSTHGRTGWKHLLMGSVAESLFRNLRCPVLTVGPRLSERFSRAFTLKKLLFAVDFSEESRTVFPYVASLASQQDCELVLVHVLPEETGMNPESRRLAEALRKDMESVYSPYLEKGCKAEFVIDFGDPAKRILDLAEIKGVDLIAMGVRNAPEFVTHFRNTITYRVVLGATCPVLTYRAP
jgi:nucleotide-binding universal stress UspA family protein